MIAFGLYLMLVKLNIIIAFDFMLVIAVAFIGGYAYRRSTGDKNAGFLLLVGNILTGVYLSNHLSHWLSGIPGTELILRLDTIFYIGLALLATWLIEYLNGASPYGSQKGFLILGSVFTLFGGYDVLLTALNISPALIRNLMFPILFIGIGLILLLSTGRKAPR